MLGPKIPTIAEYDLNPPIKPVINKYEIIGEISGTVIFHNTVDRFFRSIDCLHGVGLQVFDGLAQFILVGQIFRSLLTNKFYLELKDVGSRRKSYPEKMYQKIQNLAAELNAPKFDIEGALKDRDFIDTLEYDYLEFQVLEED